LVIPVFFRIFAVQTVSYWLAEKSAFRFIPPTVNLDNSQYY